MNALESDIADRVRADFPGEEAREAINLLEEAGVSQGRIARCIVVASEGSIESLRQYIEMAERDPRDVIVAAEYDLPLQKRDLRASFLIDSPEKFWIGGIAAALHSRGFVLKSLESRAATAGPFEYTSDRGEGSAEFVGAPFPITIAKTNRHWTLHGDPEDLDLYDLNRPFDDEAAFRDAVSCYLLAKQR